MFGQLGLDGIDSFNKMFIEHLLLAINCSSTGDTAVNTLSWGDQQTSAQGPTVFCTAHELRMDFTCFKWLKKMK